jgi:hypothetical protein
MRSRELNCESNLIELIGINKFAGIRYDAALKTDSNSS